MRTDADSASVRVKKKKRSPERSKRLDNTTEGSVDGEWKQFTSPDGHPYYYNAVTKESRWELTTAKTRSKHRRTKGNSSKNIAAEVELDVSTAPKAVHSEGKETGDDADADKSAVKPKSVMFQKLQASLEGKLNVMPSPMMGRPPMVSIRREEDSYSGGAVTVEMETKTQTLEEQYEAETANMSAAERLRFLRRKRQEEMLAKKASVAEDDFMAEFANNMKKKGATRKPKQEEVTGDKAQQWKEQEAAEEERKKRQMMEEGEAKEQEAQRKEREQQAAMEREEQREQERAEQLVLEQQREVERKQRQEEQERARQVKEETKAKKTKKTKKETGQLLEKIVQDDTNHENHDGRKSGISENEVQDDASSLAVGEPSAEGRKHRRRSRSRGSKHGSLALSAQEEVRDQAESVVEQSPPRINNELSDVLGADEFTTQDEKRRAREERRARKLREQELPASPQREQTQTSVELDLSRKSVSSTGGQREELNTRSTSSVEAEEEARAREKQLRRERRRMAKLEAAMAAQQLNDSGSQEGVQFKRSHGEGMSEHIPGHAVSSNTNGSTHSGSYPVNGQAQPIPPSSSGGMYAPYPYMMPPQPPPPPPYGYYYPYMQPPPMMPMPMYPPSMGGMPPGYQLMPQSLPPSSDGVVTPSALIPYSADATFQNAYGYGMPFGQQAAPELSRCECCQGIGVGLVEKNGVCAHCNRLRLAFIVDSAQMRQRCSVCGGWGFCLLQANGMCEHCTRQTSQKAQTKLVTETAARRRSSVATSVTAAATPSLAPPRRFSTGNSVKTDGLDDIEWDKSSSDDDSDWDN